MVSGGASENKERILKMAYLYADGNTSRETEREMNDIGGRREFLE